MGVMLYFGNAIYPSTLTFTVVAAIISVTLFFDGIVMERAGSMRLDASWRTRTVPGLVVMHGGTLLIALRLLADSSVLDAVGYIVFFVGFVLLLMQIDRDSQPSSRDIKA
jgi:hypothetical protein